MSSIVSILNNLFTRKDGSPTTEQLLMLAAIGALSAAYLVLPSSQSRRKGKKRVPGPMAWPIIGNLPTAWPYLKTMRTHVLFYDLWKLYGPIYQLQLGGKVLVLVSDEGAIKTLLNNTEDYGRSDQLQRGVGGIAEEALFAFPSGAAWKRHRKILQPAFAPTHIRYATEVSILKVTKLFTGFLSRLEKRKELSIEANLAFKSLTIDVIGMVAFGHDFDMIDKTLKGLGEEEGEVLQEDKYAFNPIVNFDFLAGVAMTRIFNPPYLWHWLKVSLKDPEIVRVVDQLDTLVLDLAKDRIEKAKDVKAETIKLESNVMDRLLFSKSASEEEGGEADSFNQNEILDELKGFFFAGFETTSNSLCWLLLDLANNPAVVEKLRKELDAANITLKSADLHETLPKLHYLDQVIKESQRLHSVVQRTSRHSLKEVNLLGYTFPKHTIFLTVLGNLHLNPKLWGDDCLTFNPDRFESAESVSFKFLPFGDGPMVCIGQKIAVAEQRITIALFVSTFNVSLKGGYIPEPVTTITYGLKKGLDIVISRRGE